MQVQHIGKKNLTNITRNQLLAWHRELNNLYGTLLFHLERSKINDFISKNGQRIQSAIDGQNKIIKEYYLVNEQGGVVQVQKKDEKGEYVFSENGEPVMQGALQEGKTEEGFNKDMNDFMQGTVPFEL